MGSEMCIRDRHIPRRLDLDPAVPLSEHCRYSLDEVMAAFALVRKDNLHRVREGVFFDKPTRCNLLFVTLQKSDKQYSPDTMYNDYAMDRERFHWQSQHTTRSGSKRGLRHIEQERRGIASLLFVRETKKDAYGATVPYLLLGPATYIFHTGERLMNIIWRLKTPMPADVARVTRFAA